MRFGICGNLPAHLTEGVESVERAFEYGYDYIEPALATVAAMPAEDFAALLARVKAQSIRVEACNIFFPRTLRLTGAEVNWDAIQAYLETALARAGALGVKVIVFGSAGAKNVPEGFPYHEAWKQLVRVCRMAAEVAAKHGITIAIEPLNHKEANIVTSVAEGLALMQRVNRKEVRVLADYYHMGTDGEDLSILRTAGADLVHVHVARVDGRTFPTEKDAGLVEFFQQLKAAGYDGRVSIEGSTKDFAADAPRSLEVLRALAG